MRIVEWAVATRQSAGLLSPDPYDMLVPLTAAAVHVARMTELKRKNGGYPRSDQRVAVVTSRLHLRSAYRRLGIGAAKLFDAVPAATRIATGDIAVLGRNASNADWGTLFVNRASELRGVKGLTLVVVDLPIYDWQELQAINVPKVVVGHDPSDAVLSKLARTSPVFAWDANDLRELKEIRVARGAATLEQVAARLERIASGTTCAPIPVPSQKMCENAALFWADLGPLHCAARGSYLARELTAEAHELFQDLLHLAVPTAFYEEQTGVSFRARLRGLKHEELQARGELGELYLPMIHAELQDMAGALGAQSPKTDALIAVLRDQVDCRRDVMLVARTAILARLHEAYLANYPELQQVRVTSLGAVGEAAPADTAVLTGLAPAWARHVYLSGIASDIRVLAYAPERALLVDDGFVEAEYVRRIVGYQRQCAAFVARPACKASCWKALSGEDIEVPDDRMRVVPDQVAHVEFVPLPQAPDVPPGLWEIDARSSEQPRPPAVRSAQANGSSAVDGIRLNFTTGRWVLLDRNGAVTRFSKTLHRAEPGFDVAKLTVGDDIVFLDGDAQKDILAKVLEVAKDIPHLAAPATWVEYWRDALHRGKERFRTYTAFAEVLRARGCQRETQTVRLWVTGQTIGPIDPLDVRRVGEALDDSPLRDHNESVYQGIDAFRGAHAELMQRVGALAIHVGTATSAGVMRVDEVIDERSGLTAADFQDCIEILRIDSIEPMGRVSSAAVGRLHERSEY